MCEKFKELLPVLSWPTTSLSRHVATCTALVCWAQCSMPIRLGHWQSQTSNICSKMTGQWSDRSSMSGRKTLSPPDPLSYLSSLALRNWTSFWGREGSAGMDMWNAPMVQSRQPLTYRLMEFSVGLGGLKWHGSSWQTDCREWKLSAIDPHDRHTWRSGVRSAMRAASQLPGGPLMWMLPMYLHVNQKSDDDDDMGVAVNGVWPFEQTVHPISTAGLTWHWWKLAKSFQKRNC